MSTQTFAAKIAKLESKNHNPGTRSHRKYLSPCIGSTTVEARSQAMAEFLPKFQEFILSAGVTPEIQRSLKIEYRITVDARWNTSACDSVSATWTYLGAKFVIWSNGLTQDGGFDMHLYGDLLSGHYRSGSCGNPEEFGRKFALLTCEAERIGRLNWHQKISEKCERMAQVFLTFTMCISFIITPQTDWEKTDYFAAFFALTTCAALSYSSKIKPEDSLVDERIQQQAIVF